MCVLFFDSPPSYCHSVNWLAESTTIQKQYENEFESQSSKSVNYALHVCTAVQESVGLTRWNRHASLTTPATLSKYNCIRVLSVFWTLFLTETVYIFVIWLNSNVGVACDGRAVLWMDQKLDQLDIASNYLPGAVFSLSPSVLVLLLFTPSLPSSSPSSTSSLTMSFSSITLSLASPLLMISQPSWPRTQSSPGPRQSWLRKGILASPFPKRLSRGLKCSIVHFFALTAATSSSSQASWSTTAAS